MKTEVGYVLVSEASRILGVSADTLRSWGDSGKLKVTLAGRVRLFDRNEVEKLATDTEKRAIPKVPGNHKAASN